MLLGDVSYKVYQRSFSVQFQNITVSKLHSKKRQREVDSPFPSVVNFPARWKFGRLGREGFDSPPKRSCITQDRDQYLMDAFMEQLEIQLSSYIRHCYQTGGNTDALFQTEISRSRLPCGIVTGAEVRIQEPAGEIEKLLRRKRKDKISLQRWKDFVEKEFYNIADRIEQGNDEMQESDIESMSTTTNVSQHDREAPIRTFGASLMLLIRIDLPVDIKDEFLKTIRQTLTDASDYIIEYSIQVYKLLLAFKEACFIKQGNKIVLERKTGPLLEEIVPADFVVENGVDYLPPPFDRTILTSDFFEKDFESLFNKGHLQRIHSNYFEPRGVTANSLSHHPFQKALFAAVKKEGVRNKIIDTYIVKMTQVKYMINFENIWKAKYHYTKMLNRVLIVLLRIHLAPERKRKKIERLQEIVTQDNTKTTRKLYYTRRNMIKNERKNKTSTFKRHRKMQQTGVNGKQRL
ncbi:hypothetical protein RMATCC62417_11281 [Rhizopus microsporus]|nr:hypothetical protein RMATCC62417_11281 [Rhizopus microsporus]